MKRKKRKGNEKKAKIKSQRLTRNPVCSTEKRESDSESDSVTVSVQ